MMDVLGMRCACQQGFGGSHCERPSESGNNICLTVSWLIGLSISLVMAINGIPYKLVVIS